MEVLLNQETVHQVYCLKKRLNLESTQESFSKNRRLYKLTIPFPALNPESDYQS